MSNELFTKDLYLVLGCFGRIDDGFVNCASCENYILRIHTGLENYNGMMDYFDTCRLYDKPTFDFNAIRHILQNMQERFDQLATGRRLWSEPKVQLHQKFLMDHRFCGLYLKLALANEDEKEEPEEKSIPIVAHSKQRKLVAAPKVNLKLIRGRR